MDTAKEMVRKSLKTAQFKQSMLEKVWTQLLLQLKQSRQRRHHSCNSCLSAAKENLTKLITALENEGVKGKVTVMIGGAAVTKEMPTR